MFKNIGNASVLYTRCLKLKHNIQLVLIMYDEQQWGVEKRDTSEARGLYVFGTT